MRIGRFARRATPVLIAATLIAAAPSAWAEATDAYYERTLVLAAHDRCDLFEPGLVRALDAARLSARGSALRAGAEARDLRLAGQRARTRAASLACADSDLRLVRARVTEAFSGWARMARMTFAGGKAGWTADRTVQTYDAWRLAQTSATGGSPVTFGLAAHADGTERVQGVVSFVGRPRPYAARIVMRDAERARHAVPGQLPDPVQRRAFWASRNDTAARGLLSRDRKAGDAWTFPADTLNALARLDPREPFVIEFLFRDDSVAKATFEAGDIAAARAFVAMGPVRPESRPA